MFSIFNHWNTVYFLYYLGRNKIEGLEKNTTIQLLLKHFMLYILVGKKRRSEVKWLGLKYPEDHS